MKVGIISKPAHAKGMVQTLRGAGHKPITLGGSPPSLPSSLDVIVCRRVSCAHAGYDLAMEERRTGSRPVVFEDGAQRALEALQEIEAGTYDPHHGSPDTEAAPAPAESPNAENPSERGSCHQALVDVINSCGLFFVRLQDRSTSQIIDLLTGMRMTQGRKAKAETSEVLKKLTENFAERTIAKQFSRIREAGQYHEAELWWKSERGRKGAITVLSVEPLTPEQVVKLAELSGYLAEEPDEGTLTLPPRQKAPEPVEPVEAAEAVEAEPVEPEPQPAALKVTVATVNDAEIPAEVKEATPAAVRRPVDPEKELEEILTLLRDQMSLLGLSEVPIERLNAAGLAGSLTLQTVHLASPEGVACNHAHSTGVRVTKVPSEVTCGICQSTKFFSTVTWILENMGGAK